MPQLDNADKEQEDKKPDLNDKVYCIVSGNGYNIIKKAMEAKPGWREIKKDVVWNQINGTYPSHYVNFIWKPVNFNYKVSDILSIVTHLNSGISDHLFDNYQLISMFLIYQSLNVLFLRTDVQPNRLSLISWFNAPGVVR